MIIKVVVHCMHVCIYIMMIPVHQKFSVGVHTYNLILMHHNMHCRLGILLNNVICLFTIFYRIWFNVGAILILINIGIAAFLIIYLSWVKKVSSDDWEKTCPTAIPIATGAFIMGGVWYVFMGGVWYVFMILYHVILLFDNFDNNNYSPVIFLLSRCQNRITNITKITFTCIRNCMSFTR